MIDPTAISNFNSTTEELEEVILFWTFAAGHNGRSTARGVETLLSVIEEELETDRKPFANIDALLKTKGKDRLLLHLSKSSLGCWRRKCRTLEELVSSGLDLHKCSVEALEGIYGIGPKTARGFVMHTRKDARYACIDTHLLKFMRSKGIDAPKSTPTGQKYRQLEQAFLRICDEGGKNPAQYDLEIWNRYSR